MLRFTSFRTIRHLLIISLILVFLATAGFARAAGPTTVGLGSATNFAILAGSGITNTGSTIITGDVGTYPTPSETGFGSVTLNGTNQAGDTLTQGAKTDLTNAYIDAAGRTPVSTIPTELGGSTLTPGVYNSSAGTFGITGTLTLDGQGDPNAAFIFQMASTLITASGSNIFLIHDANPCNVFWQVGSSATLGTSSQFEGTILALTDISAKNGATVDGRLLARNGAVTLDSNTITRGTCATVAATVPTTATTITPASSSATNTSTTTYAPAVLGTSTSAITPKLPNTGFNPVEKGYSLWNIAISAGVVIALISISLYLLRKNWLISASQ